MQKAIQHKSKIKHMLLISACMFVFSIGKAQEKRESFSDLDAKSYQLYLDKNWTAVIETVEKSFRLRI